MQSQDYEKATQIIQNIKNAREHHVFQSVGKLTRALHNAIVNFNVDANLPGGSENLSEMTNASDRLQGVIDMTAEAANKTMDRIEVAAPIARSLGEEAAELQSEWQKLGRCEIDKEGFIQLYARIERFLIGMGEGTSQLDHSLQSIILEQGFQDLTGQVLKKVIGLITQVEKELVTLVSIAGQVDEATGIEHEVIEKPDYDSALDLEGPQLNAGNRPGIAHNQNDVDDLLSSLGF